MIDADSSLATMGAGAYTLPLLPDRSPLLVYLARFPEVSRRGMRDALDTIARLAVPFASAEDIPWHAMRYQHVAAVRAHLIAHYGAPASVNKALSGLRGVLREAFNLGLMSADDLGRCAGVKNVRGTRLPKGRALSQEELAFLFTACATDRPLDVRDSALLAMLCTTGVRRSEVVALDLGNFDRHSGALRVLGKGDKERFVYLLNETRAYQDRWISVRGEMPGPYFVPVKKTGALVFRRLTDQSVLVVVRRLAVGAGIESVSPHDFRRTFASDAIDASKDLLAVQALLGHASPATTQKYDRRGERAKVAAARLIRLPPPRHE
jgi:site-specific recombinase XerD